MIHRIMDDGIAGIQGRCASSQYNLPIIRHVVQFLVGRWAVTWFFQLRRMASRILLGNPGETSALPCHNQRQIIDAYGQCIAVLLASTKTYVEHKLSLLADTDPRRSSVEKCLSRIRDLDQSFEATRRAAAEARHKGGDPEIGGEPIQAFEHYVEIDAQMIAIIPDDFLVARRWILLDRMRRIAPQKALIEYEGSLPPSMDKDLREDADKIRADLLSLSTYMQQLYVLNSRREETLASVKWWLFSRSVAVVLMIAVIFLLATTTGPRWSWWRELPWMPTAMAVLFLTGMIGAVVSISRKFQDIGGQNILVADPFNELVSLNFSRESVACSIMAGGVFAMVLYLVVISGSAAAMGLDLRFFPSLTAQRTIIDLPAEGGKAATNRTSETKRPETFSKPAPGATTEQEAPATGRLSYVLRAPDHVPGGIARLSKALGFFYDADILRMMLLAFIAGFAERLVPDSIDRLVRKEKAVKDAAV